MSATEDLAHSLQRGCEALGLVLQPAQQRQLLDYLALLQKWNKVYNLTAVRDPAEMLRLHLLDCLAVVSPFTRAITDRLAAGLAPKVLDVGAGGGLPGVVLAICCPQVQVHCVDAVAKKMAFVQQVAAQLPLANLHAHHARVEALQEQYTLIVSRAFASLADFVQLTQPLLAPGGAWMAMKGRQPEDEMAALPVGIEVFHVEPVTVPGLDAERCLVWLRPDSRGV
ncbi:16S rRNA methyltransferase [Lampropedia cohaerens]|uniref:Ribosomal RNA small subunit methyltransferase G n=1 Tax=Lampropedia cohaerens TaxID=1610491 RepID=A0A0U1PYI5_9BURK|nr:16S rRNA (guanine(527)-N(7))-methyltransferase RsmG [Lampropedia cohaerens]KKW67527.1 16S rRNA methyltransferase [Lampropedia cohaerens]